MARWGLRTGVQWLLATVVLLSAETAFAQVSAMRTNRLPNETGLNRHGLTRAWWGHAVTNSSRDKLLHLTLDEDRLYVQSSNGIITAFDNESGKRQWATQVGTADKPIYPATTTEDVLLTVNGMQLYALDKRKGTIIWELTLPGQPTSSPVPDKDRLFMGFLDGSVFCLDLKKVAELHANRLLPQWSYQTVLWRFKTSKSVTSPPIPDGRLVVFASRNGTIYSVSAQSRDLIFQYETDSALSADLKRYKNHVLVAAQDYNFYAVNMSTGETPWVFPAGFPIVKAPLVVRDEVYLMPERGGLFKISPLTGRRIWWRPRLTDVISAGQTRLYAKDTMNNLVILNREDGAIFGGFPLDQYTKYLANEISDRLYLATEGGLIVCLRETNRDLPIYHRNPDRQPITPEFAPEGEDDDPNAPAAELLPAPENN